MRHDKISLFLASGIISVFAFFGSIISILIFQYTLNLALDGDPTVVGHLTDAEFAEFVTIIEVFIGLAVFFTVIIAFATVFSFVSYFKPSKTVAILAIIFNIGNWVCLILCALGFSRLKNEIEAQKYLEEE